MVHPVNTSGGVKVVAMGVGGGPLTVPTGGGGVSENTGRQLRYEQTTKLASYTDPHMLFHMLNWLREKQLYPVEDIDAARIAVLSHTSMISAITEVSKDSGRQPSFDIEAKRQHVLSTHNDVEQAIRPFVMCIQKVWKDKDTMIDRKSMQDLSDWWLQQRTVTEAAMADEGKPPAQIQEALDLHVAFPANIGSKALLMCKSFYESGDYTNALRWLLWCENRVCEVTTDALDFEARKRASWGILCALIMLTQLANTTATFSSPGRDRLDGETNNDDDNLRASHVSEAAERILKIDEALDDSSKMLAHSPAPQLDPASENAQQVVEAAALRVHGYEDILVQRTWLLHMALWPLFRYYLPKSAASGTGSLGRSSFSDLVEWFLLDRNMSLVKLVCPYFSRYYAVWAILNRNRADHFKQIIEMITVTSGLIVGLGESPKEPNKATSPDDPFSALLIASLVLFDFDEAKQKLAECAEAAESDFFLSPLRATIEEHSRLLIFETYCRIHKSINIDMIATQLNMPSDTAERWIVNLIRHARLEAKIDSERNRVEISNETPNIYQQVMDKCRNVMARSQALVQSIDRLPSSGAKAGGDDWNKGERTRDRSDNHEWKR